MDSSLLSIVYTRQFTLREWPQKHAPRDSVQLVRAVDRCLQGYLQRLSVGDDAIDLRWQYQLWPRELTVGLASEQVAALTALPGLKIGELRAAIAAGIDAWLLTRKTSEPVAPAAIAGALS